MTEREDAQNAPGPDVRAGADRRNHRFVGEAETSDVDRDDPAPGYRSGEAHRPGSGGAHRRARPRREVDATVPRPVPGRRVEAAHDDDGVR
jgi:hypothetical protein